MTIPIVTEHCVSRSREDSKSSFESLKAFINDAKLLSEQKDALTKRYPNKWIALYHGKTIAIEKDLNKLIRVIKKHGFNESEVVTQFLGTKKLTMIL